MNKVLPVKIMIIIFLSVVIVGFNISLPKAHAAMTCDYQVSPPLCQPTGNILTFSNPNGDVIGPAVYGNIISYNNNPENSINFYDLSSGTTTIINNQGGYDYLSSTNGRIIVYENATLGVTGRGIESYDISSGIISALELSNGNCLEEPAIGGQKVVFESSQCALYYPSFISDIQIYDLSTGTTSTLFGDGKSYNFFPSISPDGSVITWVHCNADSSNCNIYDAIQNCSPTCNWTINQLTNTGYANWPHTNGKVVVYDQAASGSDFPHVFIQPVNGGTPKEISPSYLVSEFRSSISGNLISFEGAVAIENNYLYVYDMNTGIMYQITNSPSAYSYTNSAIYLSPSGAATVAWNSYGSIPSSPFFISTVKVFTFTPTSLKQNCIPNNGGANLKGASISDCNLAGYNLSGDNLKGANLSNSDLSGANLQNTNLQGANLSGANLQNANLQGANLNGANLSGANVDGANFSGANLNGVTTTGCTGTPLNAPFTCP